MNSKQVDKTLNLVVSLAMSFCHLGPVSFSAFLSNLIVSNSQHFVVQNLICKDNYQVKLKPASRSELWACENVTETQCEIMLDPAVYPPGMEFIITVFANKGGYWADGDFSAAVHTSKAANY